MWTMVMAAPRLVTIGMLMKLKVRPLTAIRLRNIIVFAAISQAL